MCTKEETKQAVQEVLHETGDDGTTVIGREVNRHIDRKTNQIISTLTLRFGVPFVILVLSGAAMWYSLSYQVEKNTEAINDGGRWTEEDHDVYAREVERRFLEMDEDLNELKSDIRVIRQAVVGY